MLFHWLFCLSVSALLMVQSGESKQFLLLLLATLSGALSAVTATVFGGMLSFQDVVATPNDPKLSDGGGWRGLCRWVERWRRSVAQAVTAGAVRCSAWLGVFE